MENHKGLSFEKVGFGEINIKIQLPEEKIDELCKLREYFIYSIYESALSVSEWYELTAKYPFLFRWKLAGFVVRFFFKVRNIVLQERLKICDKFFRWFSIE